MTQPSPQQEKPDVPFNPEDPEGHFQALVLPRLLDCAFGSDDGWKKYQWAQFTGAVITGGAVAITGLSLISSLTFGEPRPNEQVVFPFATGLVGTGLGLIAGACALNMANGKGGGKK